VSLFDWYAMSEKKPGSDVNQDCLVTEPGYGVFVIADGMGGPPGGAQASQVATREFVNSLRRFGGESRLTDEVLRGAVAAANKAVWSIAEAEPAMAGMGTTLTALVMGEKRGKIAHVGDSRAYCFSRGRLEPLTEDHTVAAELTAKLPFARRQITRMVMQNILSRAIGTRPTVEPDLVDLEVRSGEWFLLCSDGLYNVLPAEVFAEAASAGKRGGARAICEAVMAEAMKVNRFDDASLIVVRPLELRE
jgi:PPM family protein phosphatase